MTPRLRDVVQDVAGVLHARSVAFALVGGLAVSVRTEPRFTRDADLAVAVDDDEGAQTVVRALAPRYEPVTVLEQEALGRMAAVRLGQAAHSPAGVVVDLLFASSGVEAEIVETAEPLEVFPGVQVPVARTGALVVTKLLARDASRPLDAADLHALLAVADRDDLALAERLIELVMVRGTNRGRDLREDWRELDVSER